MSSFDTVIRFLPDGGMFIYASIAILALGLAIAVERFVFLHRARRQDRRMWETILPMLRSGQYREVYGATAGRDSAIGLIVHTGLARMASARRREDIDAAMEEALMEVIPRLEKRTHYIATFAHVVTLVGLLGTIVGLTQAFIAVTQVDQAEKAQLLSAGVSIAMNNTAFALMVAIPFLLIHAFLQARTTEIVDSLEAARTSFLNVILRARGEAARRAA